MDDKQSGNDLEIVAFSGQGSMDSTSTQVIEVTDLKSKVRVDLRRRFEAISGLKLTKTILSKVKLS